MCTSANVELKGALLPPNWNTNTKAKLIPGHSEFEFKYKHKLTGGKIWIFQLHSNSAQCVMKIFKQASKVPLDMPSISLSILDYITEINSGAKSGFYVMNSEVTLI